MTNIEIPLGKRTKLYRFFEILPGVMSYGAIILLVVLSLINPFFAAIYLLLIIITTVVKAVGIAYHTAKGRTSMEGAQKTDWSDRLSQLNDAQSALDNQRAADRVGFQYAQHIANLEDVASHPDAYPKPSDIHNAVIIAAYNESFDVLNPTIQSLIDTTYDKKHLIVALAYEERGGEAMEETAKRLKEIYNDKFKMFVLIKHPRELLPGEMIGKGSNITHAGRTLKELLIKQQVNFDNVIVTTLDSDNRPYKSYFDYVTYEYIVRPDRKHLSYRMQKRSKPLHQRRKLGKIP